MAINGEELEKPIMARTQEKRRRDKAEQSEQADGKADKMGSVGAKSKSIVTKTLYHGTDVSNITEFKTTGKESSDAIFFADDMDYAEEEAYVKDEKSGNGQYIYEVKLDIKNPMYVTLSTNDFAMPEKEKPYIQKAKAQGKDAVIFTNDLPDDDIMKQTFYAVFDKKQVHIQNRRKL